MARSALVTQLCLIWVFGTLAQDLPDDWQKYIDREVLRSSLESGSQWTSGSGLFEGDISGIDRGSISQSQGQRDFVETRNSLWPDGRVPYEISANFDKSEHILLQSAMVNLSAETGNDCVTFVPRTDDDQHFVRFIKTDPTFGNCQSKVGRQFASRQRDQPIVLTSDCVQEIGTIQHEIMHALGFFHEMSRFDRDEYVTIIRKNIIPDERDQFEKYRGDMQGLDYDYESIMHYPFNAFSVNKATPTILPKKLGAPIGQRKRLSRLDVERIRRGYCPTKHSIAKVEPFPNNHVFTDQTAVATDTATPLLTGTSGTNTTVVMSETSKKGEREPAAEFPAAVNAVTSTRLPAPMRIGGATPVTSVPVENSTQLATLTPLPITDPTVIKLATDTMNVTPIPVQRSTEAEMEPTKLAGSFSWWNTMLVRPRPRRCREPRKTLPRPVQLLQPSPVTCSPRLPFLAGFHKAGLSYHGTNPATSQQSLIKIGKFTLVPVVRSDTYRTVCKSFSCHPTEAYRVSACHAIPIRYEALCPIWERVRLWQATAVELRQLDELFIQMIRTSIPLPVIALTFSKEPCFLTTMVTIRMRISSTEDIVRISRSVQHSYRLV
ncbi:zinc metalloproteinase nas-14-like [Paramacrobiotus metropolitanus]|uniref:zinc metalloproteinase nas-14-like n=1 Tax=Paramacrobiotus metropolitanus TaxID=2943436 RepID=UPI0024463201|nr:zinc metalloproteinase nas-14-like [Paramacrobiotus metropolitanus]XP_055351439.1 zinc metalloproteinase nas-14-like [Paramacrobiotus metropolitanus]